MSPRINVILPSCNRARIQKGLSDTSSCLAQARNAAQITRTMTTTATTTATTPKGQIPPESPKFIEIPKLRQPQSIYRPWVKGILPVPRKIFGRNERKDKTSQEYLSAVTPDPKYSRAQQSNPVADSQPLVANKTTWNYQQSTARRRNLRESLLELHRRKQRIDRSKAESRDRKQAESLQLATAPEREDERLTNPTIHTALLPRRRGPLPDPHREQRLERMRANVETMQRKKADERRTMLHTLYMNAREFIVEPAQLERAIDEAFDDSELFVNDDRKGENIWNLGLPETVQQLLRINERKWLRNRTDQAQWTKDLTEKRLDTIGEALTGGKL